MFGEQPDYTFNKRLDEVIEEALKTAYDISCDKRGF